jgi:nucleoside-diphosphate-sugar epimerase
MLGELVGHEVPIRYLPSVPGDARHTGGDTKKASRDLGFAPGTGLEQGLSEQLAAHIPLRPA